MPLQPFCLPGPSAIALFNLPLSPFHDTHSPILPSPLVTSQSPLPSFSTHSSQLDTPVPPQPLCYQSNAHAFRHTWGCASVFTFHFELSAPHHSLSTCPHQRHSASIIRPLFSYSYALFCTKQNAISHLFIPLRTLCRKHPGWGYPINQTALLAPHAQAALGTFSTFVRLRLREL